MPKETYYQQDLPDILTNHPAELRTPSPKIHPTEDTIFLGDSTLLSDEGSSFQKLQFLTNPSMRVANQTITRMREDLEEINVTAQMLGYEPTSESLQPVFEQFNHAVRSRTEKLGHGFYNPVQELTVVENDYRQLELEKVRGKIIEFVQTDMKPQAAVAAGD